MKFTDIFIRRPVLACVVSLVIFFMGAYSIKLLPLRAYPKLTNTVVTVTTGYPGASAGLVQGFITRVIEQQVATAEGIDYLSANSTKGSSSIEAHVKLNYSPEKAFTDIMAKVQQVTGELPDAAKQPVIVKSTGQSFASMYLSFANPNMSLEQITDYLVRVVQPQLEAVDGVSQAQVFGLTFAMRIWLNAKRMASLHITPADVAAALRKNNFQSAAGKTKGMWVAYNLNANTDLHSAKEFDNIIVARKGDDVIYLRDIAKAQLGAQSYDVSVKLNGKNAVFVGISTTPEANPLTVIQNVNHVLPTIKKQLLPGMKVTNVYQESTFLNASIYEVARTILEAGLIVILVIFCFLGSFRSVLIPVVTIPLSLIGVCTLMWILQPLHKLQLHYELSTT